jgi:NAD(P)-dependent dehydrogenase (short-subunit alcohol dehydrogenase family)
LNAGTQFPTSDHRTEDGFEATFGVNVLAHYLLLRPLLPKLARNATVVITTSDTHDPKRNRMGPREFDIEKLAHPPKHQKPTGFSAGFRAYAAFKLGDLLIARGLAASGEAKTKRLNVVAYNPGLTVGTSLFRASPLWEDCVRGCRLGAAFHKHEYGRTLGYDARLACFGPHHAAARSHLRLTEQPRA